MNLDELRSELTALDAEILTLVARRQALSGEVAAVKRATGLATRTSRASGSDPSWPDGCGAAGARARSGGDAVAPADPILARHPGTSACCGARSGKRQAALVIGGRGKMGGWFCDFLASQGFQVTIADPEAGCLDSTACGLARSSARLRSDRARDPLSATADILKLLAKRAPRGLIFDLAH